MKSSDRKEKIRKSPTYLRLKEKYEKDCGDTDEYDFLLNGYIDQETLQDAKILAAQWQVPVHHVLVSTGVLTQADYTRALAEFVGLEYMQSLPSAELNLPNVPKQICDDYRSGLCTRTVNLEGDRDIILASQSATKPLALKALIKRLGKARQRIYLVSRHQLRQAISALCGSVLTKEAVFGLENSHPGCSARNGLTRSQWCVGFLLLSCLIGLAFLSLEIWVALISGLLSIMFFFVVWLRLIACLQTLYRPFIPNRSKRRVGNWRRAVAGLSSEATLPIYTVLVPIFREKAVLPELIQSLQKLDYPCAKLDIKLIFEDCDVETIDHARMLNIPDHFEFIIVPKSHPQTKPKALNYALQFAQGDYVVIYDAEDHPHPEQLRNAVTAFRLAPINVACLQARLMFYNSSENWLTKQFSIEYAALFNGLLPTLQRLDYPIPLGGTSNHFRMSALKDIGGWDAFNVTEDADIGIRLYRNGYTARVLNSVTYEEATCRTGAWIRQRTRWIKGWMQTYAVHMRHPFKLYQQLGWQGFFGFQVMIGGFIASALIHPIFFFYALGMLGWMVVQGDAMVFPLPENIFWIVSIFNLSFGYISAMLLGAIIVYQSKMKRVSLQLLTMPIYWLFISFAAYRALFQFFWSPFLWEKTTHGVTKHQFIESHQIAVE